MVLGLLLRLCLRLVLELRRVEMAIVGHEDGGIHHSSSSIWVIHRKAVSIVILNGVVHPSAHIDDGADRKLDGKSATLAIKKDATEAPLGARNCAEGEGDGAVARHGQR